MGQEFERKFIFRNPKDAEKLIAEHSAEDIVTKIEQSYLIPKYAKLMFNANLQEWDIALNLKNGTMQSFSAPVEDKELEDVSKVLAKTNAVNLLDVPRMSSRVRFKPNKTLFTAKFKPFFEFEPVINLKEGMKELLLENLPSVSKFRHEITVNGYDVELDMFCNNASIPILELEYETEQAMNSFNPSDLGLDIIEVTEDNFYRNIYIAIRHFEQ